MQMQRMLHGPTFQDGIVRVLDLLELGLSQLFLVDGALVWVPRLTQLPVMRQARTRTPINQCWDSCTGVAWPGLIPRRT